MALSLRKTPAPAPTLAERHDLAASAVVSAIEGFEFAAQRLDRAADEQDAIISEISAQLDTLADLQDAAIIQRTRAVNAASKIRSLVA